MTRSANAKIISLSGPSKSGKSMLLKNVVDDLDYNLVTVHGSNIETVSDIWDSVLDELNAPTEQEVMESSADETTKEGNVGANVPLVDVNAGGSKRNQELTQETDKHGRKGLKQIVDMVDLEEFILFIDDAHYISEDSHAHISEGIKDAFERGMSICVAFIPHRSDDLTRANPDLSGRIESISFGYWNEGDLEKIGKKGFKFLNRFPPEILIKNLARESAGSPHLMQQLCLETCNELNIHEKADEMMPVGVNSDEIERVLRKTANNLEKKTIFEILRGAPVERGQDRNKYNFRGGLRGKEGDIYDAILRTIAMESPETSIDQRDIFDRIDDVCIGESPQSGNVTQAVQRMDNWASDYSDDEHILEWDDDRKCLEVPDPYLIFYLRWSNALDFEPNLL